MKRGLAALLLAAVLPLSALPLSVQAITVGSPKYGKNYATNVTLNGNQAHDIVEIAKTQKYKSGTILPAPPPQPLPLRAM